MVSGGIQRGAALASNGPARHVKGFLTFRVVNADIYVRFKTRFR